MFEKLKNGHKIGSIASKWVASTSIDPGDNGQVMKKSYEYMENLRFHPEDAWLTSLVVRFIKTFTIYTKPRLNFFHLKTTG